MSDWAPPAARAPSGSAPALAPGAPHGPDQVDDWPVQAADAIVNLVDSVRDRTTGPALRVAHGVVLGLAVLILAGVLGVLLLLGLVRGLHVALDNLGLSRETAVWATYLGLGGLFTLAGLWLWSKRTPATS
jgi:hypothetical protein